MVLMCQSRLLFPRWEATNFKIFYVPSSAVEIKFVFERFHVHRYYFNTNSNELHLACMQSNPSHHKP